MINKSDLLALGNLLKGDLFIDDLHKRLYATDASVYRILPLAVVCPKVADDIITAIKFVTKHNISLIPRTAGTSLAGQCVGEGIILDFSKYFNAIIEFNEKEKTVTVQPGIVRDELNLFLKPYGLFFSPNTSTSNRCMIGGMVGNNSSGSTSIKYGVTRDKVIGIEAILSDGSMAYFSSLSKFELKEKFKSSNFEGLLYRESIKLLTGAGVKELVDLSYPKKNIHRRNSAYAIDKLLDSNIFDSSSSNSLNLCNILTGSEGTLAISTKIKLKLDNLPPKNESLVILHFNSISDCLNAVNLAMTHDLYSCEMLDKTILDLTKHNKQQLSNRAFLVEDPEAILMCELRANSNNELHKQLQLFLHDIKSNSTAFAYPVLNGSEIGKAIDLRKAGLGLLGNMIGDHKAVACIEDSAVSLEDLPAYINEFSLLMKRFNQKPVYYAHAGAGELHLRPVLNLKLPSDVQQFKSITKEVAKLVKKYNGSLSGEHGNGIVRSEFIPFMLGNDVYEILKHIKYLFDPKNIFNPGKIIDAAPMDSNFRTDITKSVKVVNTMMDFSESGGILRESEKCNGSGDCRKLETFGGVMCPSFRVTKDEKHTTRARANALREYLSENNSKNVFNRDELKTVFDLCISCKACKIECPSSVDVAALKAEFEFQYNKANTPSLRTKIFALNNEINSIVQPISSIYNFFVTNGLSSKLFKKIFNIAEERSIPKVSSITLENYIKYNNDKCFDNSLSREVYLFIDEFSNYLDTSVGIDTLHLLNKLGYEVKTLNNKASGRALISKGFLDQAKAVVDFNVSLFKNHINISSPLIGIEPSAILSFKDEYLRLAKDKDGAKSIAKYTYTVEEFIANEFNVGHIKSTSFTMKPKRIKIHGHCHHKAIGNINALKSILEIPEGFKADILPTGCCGMAGSFGYEKEHYGISMKMGASLFSYVNRYKNENVIVANGTSCRHQINDGTNVKSYHPITILRQALQV